MSGYNVPCRFCGKLIPKESNVCPVCGKSDPIFLRCPKCRDILKKDWVNCPSCGLSLRIKCPKCGQETFFDNVCEKCGEELKVVCPNPKCRTEQLPVSDKCIKCGKPLNI